MRLSGDKSATNRMLKIGSIRWRGKCSRHPRFDPYLDGQGGIKGGCERCQLLAEIHKLHGQMLATMKRFSPPQPTRRRREEISDLQANLFGESQ
jgi:hypothetical protein